MTGLFVLKRTLAVWEFESVEVTRLPHEAVRLFPKGTVVLTSDEMTLPKGAKWGGIAIREGSATKFFDIVSISDEFMERIE